MTIMNSMIEILNEEYQTYVSVFGKMTATLTIHLWFIFHRQLRCKNYMICVIKTWSTCGVKQNNYIRCRFF